MSLDHVMIMNLKRREDKYLFAMGGLGVLGFWGDMVIRFIAHDGQDYPDIESVNKAAVADGFDHFTGITPYNKAHAAWIWTFQSALRYIIEIDKTVLLLIDDYFPKSGWTFLRLKALVGEANWRGHGHGTFRILQLLKSQTGDEIVNSTPHTSMLAKRLSGISDCATVLNAAGAELLLRQYKETPGLIPSGVFNRIARRCDEPEYFYGLWHTLEDICGHRALIDRSDLLIK